MILLLVLSRKVAYMRCRSPSVIRYRKISRLSPHGYTPFANKDIMKAHLMHVVSAFLKAFL